MSPIITGVRFKMFTSNGTFVVPEGVTKIYVTGCGGGGGGDTSTSAANGTATSLGSLITLSGGSYASGSRDGQSGPFGGGGIAVSGYENANGYGAGAAYQSTSFFGLAASWTMKQEITVTSGTSHSVTVGVRGNNSNSLPKGSNGFLLIEW